jgi:hypothetical protein
MLCGWRCGTRVQRHRWLSSPGILGGNFVISQNATYREQSFLSAAGHIYGSGECWAALDEKIDVPAVETYHVRPFVVEREPECST